MTRVSPLASSAIAISFGAALTACAPVPPTAVVVRVATNLDPGTSLTQLRIAAQFDGQNDAFRDQPFPLVGDASTHLPGTLLLLPDNPGDTRVFTITVTGTVAGDPRPVVQRARLSFEYQHVLVIDMFLARECIGADEISLCRPDQTCTINAAGNGPMCISTQRAPVDYDAGTAGDANDLVSSDAPDAVGDLGPIDAAFDADVIDDVSNDTMPPTDVPIDAPDAGLTPDPALSPPRAIAPLSTTTVGTRQPTLRWSLAGTDGALVTWCRDASLTSMCVSQLVPSGTELTLPTPLAPGAWHWNVRGVTGTRVSMTASVTWEFFVSAGGHIAEGLVRGVDLDADGFADLAIGAPSAMTSVGVVSVYYGSAGATVPGPTYAGSEAERFGMAIAGAGDVNGDGYGDMVVGSAYAPKAYVIEGGPRGSMAHMYQLTSPFAAPPGTGGFGTGVAGIGDFNNDGYGDVAVGAPQLGGDSGGIVVFPGSPTGVLSTPLMTNSGPASSLYGTSIAADARSPAHRASRLPVGADRVNRSAASPLAGTTA